MCEHEWDEVDPYDPLTETLEEIIFFNKMYKLFSNQ